MIDPAAADADAAEPIELEGARGHARWILMAGAALGSTAVIAARDILADAALAGASGSAIIVGAALGTSLLAALMSRLGKRFGLALG